MVSLLLFISTITSAQWIQLGPDIDGKKQVGNTRNSISLNSDGSIIAIGTPGTKSSNGTDFLTGLVQVYNYHNGVWTQIGKGIEGENSSDYSGYSVSLSFDGSTVAIGAPNQLQSSKPGYVGVYNNVNGSWIQIGANIEGEKANDHAGYAVSLSSDGSIVAIGAPFNSNNNGDNSGHVRIYKNENGSWIQVGADIDGEGADHESGNSISLSADGSIVAIGVRGNFRANKPGSVRVYKNENNVWTQIGSNIIEKMSDRAWNQVVSLSADGSIVAIGVPLSSTTNGSMSGRVKIYKNENDEWTQIGTDINGEKTGDVSGGSVSISADGSIVAIGSGSDIHSNEIPGYARVYKNQNGNWIQTGRNVDGKSPNKPFGVGVSLSANGLALAINSLEEKSNPSPVGYTRIFEKTQITDQENLNNITINVYPNPTNDYISIEGELINSIQLTNANGQSIEQSIISDNKAEIDLSNYAKGIYFLNIQTDKGKVIKKVVLK